MHLPHICAICQTDCLHWSTPSVEKIVFRQTIFPPTGIPAHTAGVSLVIVFCLHASKTNPVSRTVRTAWQLLSCNSCNRTSAICTHTATQILEILFCVHADKTISCVLRRNVKTALWRLTPCSSCKSTTGISTRTACPDGTHLGHATCPCQRSSQPLALVVTGKAYQSTQP